MAVQSGNVSSACATATLVGNAFVNQYYNVLHQSSHNVHRFYTDQSKLSRAGAGINADIVETQDKIQEKITSMELDNVRADIKTVDSLASLNGSVLVMVTGAITTRSGALCSFVQTFFLAPQENGYFVLSDICRFLDGDTEHVFQDVQKEIVGGQDNEVPPVPQQDEPENPLLDAVEISLTDTNNHVMEEENEITIENTLEEADTDALTNAHSQYESVAEKAEEQASVMKVESTEGASKLSYASILREASGASITSRQIASKVVTSQTATTSSVAASLVSSQGVTTASVAAQDAAIAGGDGHSVYAKNLPLNISQEDLEKEFQKFGLIVPGGINLRNQKQGVCYAFIQFEEADAVQKAIEASPIVLGGRQVFIQEKKVVSTGPSDDCSRWKGTYFPRQRLPGWCHEW
ncbi:hypothetical protein KP509_05G103300 [Ceratopteris richardii]|uniref:Uncharacterized protein n=1 Tax=Ceratopteris richardii TaxID=49495 RepID=A0A8T2URW4_CERRI|nr:hypothetical protein KP509_05G103300 [Ceratopteris richardii]KAH7438062.1 hypothetical protein KP509_05G103300 [Ceratopteris richardii]